MQKFLDRLLGRKRYPVLDPREFDDPVAVQTDWTPMAAGGYRRTLHRLKPIAPDVLCFQATPYRHYQTLIYGLALVVFSVTLLGQLWGGLRQPDQVWLVVMLVPTVLMCGLTVLKLSRVIVIDGGAAEVRIGLPRLNWLNRWLSRRSWLCHRIAFDSVYSVQLLDEEVRRRGRVPFWSYELNLVLQNGQRIHLIDHGNQREIRWDAGDLAKIINVPIWDFIGYRQPSPDLSAVEIKARILDQLR